MCGLSGIISKRGVVEESRLRRMISLLEHRGPDGFGVHIDKGAGLAHARLSIIDLESGDQPIHNETKKIWVVFNGEIFNYIELRADLEKKGHAFYTHSDTEVIVHLYEEYGNNFPNYLNGQFAIALWDSVKEKLLLVRDRVGIAPLYYLEDGGDFLFASEIKSILAVSQHRVGVNHAALDQLMTFWAPVSPQTMFRNVFEISPGEILEWRHGEKKIERYWDWHFPRDDIYRPGSEEGLAEELESLLIDATQIRLRSDVPVGAYLSGGLDSSVLTSLIHAHSNVPLRTFSIGFEEKGLDESDYQNEMIKHLNTKHSSIICKNSDIPPMIDEVIWHTESPILRTAPVPMYMLSGLVHDQKYKVVLTGEGADEVLGGYDIFKESKIRHFWARYPESELRPILLKRLYPYLDLSRGQAYLQNFFGAALNTPELPWFSHLPRWITTAKIKEFYSDDLKSILADDCYEALGDSLPSDISSWASFNRSQYIESKTLMAGYLLCSQGDRMLMGHSVEGRFPFLDHRVIEFANSLHPKLKMKVLNEKYLLKKSMEKRLPPSIVKRYKQPYRAPDIPAFIDQGKLSGHIKEYFGKKVIEEYGYFDPDKVSRLVRKIEAGRAIGYKDNMAFMGIMTTQIWHDKFIKLN